MRYEVEIGGRLRHVVVARAPFDSSRASGSSRAGSRDDAIRAAREGRGPGDGFAVTIDGHTRHVDVARIDTHTLSLVVDSVSPDVTRRSHEVTVAADPAGALTVLVGSIPVGVTLNGRRRWGRKDDGRSAGTGPQQVVAPMPGKVVRVLVKSGDAVAARQPVLVVEAMKMENEVRAGREGTVTEVHAREGMSVDAGALLLVIQ